MPPLIEEVPDRAEESIPRGEQCSPLQNDFTHSFGCAEKGNLSRRTDVGICPYKCTQIVSYSSVGVDALSAYAHIPAQSKAACLTVGANIVRPGYSGTCPQIVLHTILPPSRKL